MSGQPLDQLITSLKRGNKSAFKTIVEDRSGRLENQIYTATFRNETIEEILEAFKEDTPFEYIIDNSKIIITDPIIN